jgi:hypothetical protein
LWERALPAKEPLAALQIFAETQGPLREQALLPQILRRLHVGARLAREGAIGSAADFQRYAGPIREQSPLQQLPYSLIL